MVQPNIVLNIKKGYWRALAGIHEGIGQQDLDLLDDGDTDAAEQVFAEGINSIKPLIQSGHEIQASHQERTPE